MPGMYDDSGRMRYRKLLRMQDSHALVSDQRTKQQLTLAMVTMSGCTPWFSKPQK